MANQSKNRCPRCERQLARTPQGRYCPYCGCDFPVSPEDIEAGEYFTGAECGVLGFLAGLELGAALGLAAGSSAPASTLLAVSAAAGALLGAVLGGWLGYRLAAPVRRNFKLLLLSACAAGIIVLALAATRMGNVDTIVAVEVLASAVIYVTALYVQRHSRRRGDAEDADE